MHYLGCNGDGLAGTEFWHSLPLMGNYIYSHLKCTTVAKKNRCGVHPPLGNMVTVSMEGLIKILRSGGRAFIMIELLLRPMLQIMF